jgi:hypothetical protein
MFRLRALLLSFVALLMLLGSSYAVGLHSGISGCGANQASSRPAPANLPLPADLLCGKRVMAASPEVKAHVAVEVPRATKAQWRFGLASDPMREGRSPRLEPKPPRAT